MVKLQLLLRREWRKPEGIAAVKRIAERLGITPTGAGTASVSGEATEAAFQALFATLPKQVEPRRPGGQDFGAPGGYVADELAIPDQLLRYVQSITIASPHIRLDDMG